MHNLNNKSGYKNLHKSKHGYFFDFKSDAWQLDGSYTVYLAWISKLDSKTANGFKKTLCRYAEEHSACHTKGLSEAFRTYMKYSSYDSLTVQRVTNYRSTLSDEDEYKLGKLKGFLLAWYDWGFGGIDNEVAKYLEELILKGMVKGKAVSGACPYSGPLTDQELGALLEWSSNAFSTQLISLKEYSNFLALCLTGRRPVQIRSLRACDLLIREDKNGNDYILNCPRNKQQGMSFRSQFTPITINEDLYLVLYNQKEESIKLIEKMLNEKLPIELQEQIPIFLSEYRLKEITDIKKLIVCLQDTPDYLHMTMNSASTLIRNVSIKNQAYSERTGDYIHFIARRFRYTKGTNLSRRGITGVALAAALDHSDTQNIGIYTENTEETAKQIDEIMAPVLAPLAQAFAGKLIPSEREATIANDPNSRIKNAKSKNIGNCGTYAFCASGYRACYTCSNFQPWLDAPHNEVLDEIIDERKRQEKMAVSSNVIQSTDRLLLAVQQVILMCEKEKQNVKEKELING